MAEDERIISWALLLLFVLHLDEQCLISTHTQAHTQAQQLGFSVGSSVLQFIYFALLRLTGIQLDSLVQDVLKMESNAQANSKKSTYFKKRKATRTLGFPPLPQLCSFFFSEVSLWLRFIRNSIYILMLAPSTLVWMKMISSWINTAKDRQEVANVE